MFFAFLFILAHRDTSDPKDPGKRVKKTLAYCPLKTALKPYSWEKLNRVQTKELNPAVVLSVLCPFVSVSVFVKGSALF